jgi:hypothetical protein
MRPALKTDFELALATNLVEQFHSQHGLAGHALLSKGVASTNLHLVALHKSNLPLTCS